MSEPDLKHLSKQTAEIVSKSKHERIKYLQNRRWIGYPVAKQILTKLDNLANHKPIERMPNLLIYGRTNNGKTTLVKQFTKRWGSKLNEDTGIVEYPIFYMQMPPSPEESRFYDCVLNILKAPFRQRDSIARKQTQAITIMRNLGVKLLIIDEFHHLLIGPVHKQRLLLQSLKYLTNELKIPIVAVGTEDALRAIRVEAQVSNRFDQVELKKWKLDDNFKRLLGSFEKVLPLPAASKLQQAQIALKLYSMSEGSLGELSRVINLACEYAIKKDLDLINLNVLSKIDWAQPSSRLA